ncbi:cation:proton antiporter [Dehalococcoidia bacterium]|nr:cation:proton antiporter [Dehalococcoidia bacterium]
MVSYCAVPWDLYRRNRYQAVFGPHPPDRLVGLDTLNTLVIVSMVVLGAAFENPIYIDVAIVYGLLSFVATLFIAKYIEKGTF